MKKLLVAVLMLLMLCLHAQAEENMYYTLSEDIYFHINAFCGGVENRVPLSETAAKEFQKYLCPVCGPIKKDISAKSVVRGGTIVSRIPQSWLNQERAVQGMFAAPGIYDYSGSDVYARLSELLHGEEYQTFMAEYDEKQRAEATVRVPDIIWPDGDLVMNQRHFGGAYYIVLRPAAAFEDNYTTYMRFFEHDLVLENGMLKERVEREWSDADFSITLHRTGGNAVYSGISGDLQITVFAEMDENIAVITQANADQNFLVNVPMLMDGIDTGVRLNGYMDGANAVYCCVLTDAEMSRIQSGAALMLQRVDLSDAEFDDTPYAIVLPGDGNKGLIDRNHAFLLTPAYSVLNRTELDHIFVGFEDGTYNAIVYNAEEQRMICVLDKAYYGSSFGWHDLPEIIDENLFMVDVRSCWRIHSLKTGEQLAEVERFDEAALNAFAQAYGGGD